MKIDILSFEHKQSISDNPDDIKSFIDFRINDNSLIDLLGTDELFVTPFGWSNNFESQQSAIKRLLSGQRSNFENGLQSAYVCPNCGDEGCGAIMLRVTNQGDYITWDEFVYSDGYPSELESDELISNIKFHFSISDYNKEINKLQKMIIKTAHNNGEHEEPL